MSFLSSAAPPVVPARDDRGFRPDVREQARLIEPRPKPRDIRKAEQREDAAEEREQRGQESAR